LQPIHCAQIADLPTQLNEIAAKLQRATKTQLMDQSADLQMIKGFVEDIDNKTTAMDIRQGAMNNVAMAANPEFRELQDIVTQLTAVAMQVDAEMWEVSVSIRGEAGYVHIEEPMYCPAPNARNGLGWSGKASAIAKKIWTASYLVVAGVVAAVIVEALQPPRDLPPPLYKPYAKLTDIDLNNHTATDVSQEPNASFMEPTDSSNDTDLQYKQQVGSSQQVIDEHEPFPDKIENSTHGISKVPIFDKPLADKHTPQLSVFH